MRIIATLSQYCLFIATVSLAGCALIPLHKPDIEHGNIINADMMQQLKKGMSKQQVLYLLGTPVLENGFVSNHWYYVYTFQSGKTGSLQHKYLVIYFKNNIVVDIKDGYPTKPQFES